jgi:hypothetical protein
MHAMCYLLIQLLLQVLLHPDQYWEAALDVTICVARNHFLSFLKVITLVTILSTFTSRYNKDTILFPILLLSDFPKLILFDYSIHARRGSWRGIRKSTNNLLYVVQQGL